MAKPTSDVAICNLAMGLINEDKVQDIEAPDTKAEIACSEWYDLTRRQVLESTSWIFAQTSEAIPRGGTPTITRYSDYYVFPNNYLLLTNIGDPDYPLQRYDYRIEGKKLLMNNSAATSLDVWFIQDIEDVTLFPGYFSMLLAAELALNVAPQLTAKPSKLTFLSEYIKERRRVALGANGKAQPPRRYEKSNIVTAGVLPSTNNQVAGNYEFLFDAN